MKQGIVVTDKYVFFYWGDTFSNFSDHHIKVGDYVFKTGEHYFHWRKAMYFGDIQTADLIYRAETPKEAKHFGRNVRFFRKSEWDKAAFPIMFDVVKQKALDNPDVKTKLLELGKGRHFVEASPYDKIWGIGLSAKDAIGHENAWGKNLLGKCWDLVYTDLTTNNRTNISNGQLELQF